MPPWACSKRPERRAVAPEKAPRSWPNSSLSSRVAGMAAQLMATKRPLRPEARWSARATRSLPVPVSPVMRTAASLGPTRAIRRRRDSMAGLSPTRWPGRDSSSSSRWRSSFRALSVRALRSAVSRRSGEGGFSTKSVAPSFRACTASAGEASPERTTTGAGRGRGSRASSSSPVSPGMRRSSSTRSGGPSGASSRREASAAERASTGWKPSSESSPRRPFRTPGSSSTRRMRGPGFMVWAERVGGPRAPAYRHRARVRGAGCLRVHGRSSARWAGRVRCHPAWC